jgi:hypothetical protein
MHVFNFSCDGRVDLENHLEAAKEFQRIHNIQENWFIFLVVPALREKVFH